MRLRTTAFVILLASCHHGPWTPIGERYNADASVDNGLPIKHIIVITKENHTFDNYFGSFPGAEGVYSPNDASWYHQHDLPHQRGDALRQWNGGKMDGWTDTYASAQYRRADIPAYWLYAERFTLADHFFASSFGPSFPGHLFLLAGQAAGSYEAPPTRREFPFWGCDQGQGDLIPVREGCSEKLVEPCFDIPSVPDVLPAGVSWRYYGTNFYGLFDEIWTLFDAIRPIRYGAGWKEVVAEDQLTADIANHALPNVSWLVDQDFASEHPAGGSPCMGENWTEYYVNAIMESEYWASIAILITWDDYGGWYDHVPPPQQYGCEAEPYGLGFRLPLIIVSPYAKAGFIFREQSEQASIPRFIEKVFGARALSELLDPAARDGQANDLFGAFDFTQTPLAPLVILPRKCPNNYQ